MKSVKEICFKYITNPVARLIDCFNPKKRKQLDVIHAIMIKRNMYDFIEMIAMDKFRNDLRQHRDEETLEPEMREYLIRKYTREAYKIYKEKKSKGDIDEYNVLIN